MSFWRISKIKQRGSDRVTMAGLLVAVIAAAGGLIPLTALAVTPPSGAFEVGSTSSGICLQVSGETSGSSVLSAGCNNKINQKWYIERVGYYNGAIAYYLETAKAGSNVCMNDIGASTAPASPVNVANCNGILPSQRFVVINGNEYFNLASSECLDATTPGAQLVLNPCNASSPSQMLFQVPNTATP
jgi:ricin-type beta-trefoil lectin protein